jgi:SPOR domain
MLPETRSNTAILAGQIASALIGFALGVVATLLIIVDWTAPAATVPPSVASAAVTPPPPASAATSAVSPPPATATTVAAEPVTTPPSGPANDVPVPPATDPPAAPAPTAAAPPAPVAAGPVAAPQPVAAKPPKPRPKPAEPSPKRARFVVQAGAFVRDDIAAKVAARLNDHDHPAEVLVRTDDSGRAWNVVRLTEIYATRGEAERVSIALKRDEEVDTLIIRLPPAKPDVPAAPPPADATPP